MKSIALYYRKREDKVDSTTQQTRSTQEDRTKKATNVELHINVWKIETKLLFPKYQFCFDFGIMFPIAYEQLYLYLPFNITNDMPEDLAKLLMNNQKTLGAIFNSNVKLSSRANGNYCTVTFPKEENRPNFSLYHLGNLNFEKTPFNEDSEKGVCLKIKIVDNQPNEDIEDFIYVRFRVTMADNDPYLKTEHISNDLLQSAFSNKDLFDIRINETRVLNSKVKEKMTHEHFSLCEFDKVHLFFMADTREKVENGSSLKQDTRMLESEQWERYMPKTDLFGASFIAYHWKRRRKMDMTNSTEYLSPPLTSFSVFFSSVYPQIHVLRLIAYLGVIVVLGWLGSMLTFHLSDIMLGNSQNYVKLIFIVAIFVYLLYFCLHTNFGITGFKIYRKR